MKISEIIAHLEEWAPPSLQESYDNSGLIVGSPLTDVTGVLVALDCTEAIVEEAIAKNCNLIVAHHPIVFSGLKKFNGKNYVERTVIAAIKNNIAIYAIHTNLDNVHTGVNAKIAAQLGLKNTRVLAPKTGLLKKFVTFCPADSADKVREALWAAGAGYIGNYDKVSYNLEGHGTYRGNENSNPVIGEKGKFMRTRRAHRDDLSVAHRRKTAGCAARVSSVRGNRVRSVPNGECLAAGGLGHDR
jgi:dinuclear metal center YbgI/SA1388 family protein